MRRLLLMIATCCLMTACSSGAPRMLEADPIEVQPPANLITRPKPLPQPASGAIQELEANHREVAKAYHDLASQTCRLLQFLQLSTEGCEPWTKSISNKQAN